MLISCQNPHIVWRVQVVPYTTLVKAPSLQEKSFGGFVLKNGGNLPISISYRLFAMRNTVE